MNSEGKRPSAARKWWLLLAGIVVFAVSLTLLENLLGTESTPSEADSEPLQPAAPPSPPELSWTDDGAIEITEKPFRPSTIRLQNEEKKQQLFDCLEQRLEETFGNGTEGWDRVGVWRETQRIKGECMDSLRDIPVPPTPPQPGD